MPKDIPISHLRKMGAELLPAPNTGLFIPRASEELITSNDIYETLKESLGTLFQCKSHA